MQPPYHIPMQHLSLKAHPYSSFPASIHPNTLSQTAVPVRKRITQVNTLWAFSLALNLIAGLYTISVQQWLHHLRIPSHLTTRERARIQELRGSGVIGWGVEEIINILPAAVQVSVLLFLIGLALYIQTLDDTIYEAYLFVSSIFTVIWVMMSFLPLVWSSCPYKSPVIPATIALARIFCLAIVVLCIFIGVLLQLAFATSTSSVRLFLWMKRRLDDTPQSEGNKPRHPAYLWLLSKFASMIYWVANLGSISLTWSFYSTTLWLDRELATFDANAIENLDCAAICAATRILPESEGTAMLRKGLFVLPPQRHAALLAQHYVPVYFERHHWPALRFLRRTAVIFVGKYSTYHDLLYGIRDIFYQCLVSQEDTGGEGRVEEEFAMLLCLIYRSTLSNTFQPGNPSDLDFLRCLPRELCRIQSKQECRNVITEPYERIPTSLLFGLHWRHQRDGNLSPDTLLTVNGARVVLFV